MATDNWVVENLVNALEDWQEKLTEIWQFLTTSPEAFRGGGIWQAVVAVYEALTAIGLSLLVLFFVMGVVRTCASVAEMKRPEQAVKLFIRFALAKAAVTYGMDLMLAVMEIGQGMVSQVLKAAGVSAGSGVTLPQSIITAIEDCGLLESIPLWVVTLICSLAITVLGFILILTVYGRFFKIYLYMGLSPVALSAFAGQPSQSVGLSFLKAYAGVCLEGVIIAFSCVIFSLFASAPPQVDASASAVTQVWTYIGSLIFDMLILVGTIKASSTIVREMMGL